MGCCNEPVTSLAGLSVDPSQHVNYELGMVLGVDDFKQEFAYQSGRDQWLARDGLGFGTLNGLRVSFEDAGTQGRRLRVAAGSALLPSGQLVCVASDQCAVLDQWLAKPANAAVTTRLLAPSSPPVSPPAVPEPGATGSLSLYLVLSYTDCQTRPVPIPGEPCRSEEDLMKPSRVADDYRLELRENPPAQVEEDALRDFVRWLRANVQVAEASPSPLADEAAWRDALREAVRPWVDGEEASPPLSPPVSFDTLGDYLFDLPLPLVVASTQLGDFLRVALRFWVTELRWRWMAMHSHQARQADVNCVLLARVSFDVHWVSGSPRGVWMLAGSPPVVHIDESRRPVLAHARLLQELTAWGAEAGAQGAALAPAGLAPELVAVQNGGTGLSALPATGQLLIGSGDGYALGSLAGTANQISVTASTGQIKLAGPQDLDTTAVPSFAGLRTSGAQQVAVVSTAADMALNRDHHVVLCDGGQVITLPKCSLKTKGLTYVVKSISADSKLATTGTDTISGPTATPELIKKSNAKTVVSDGVSAWHVIATVA